MKPPSNVLVIGGGPAGAACAIRLRQRGVEVELAERSRFPRAKVCGCCLGGAGLDALETIGVRDWVETHGRLLRRWCGSFDGRPVELDLRRGVAISRQALDLALLSEAARCGALLHQPVTARIESVGDSVGTRGGDPHVWVRLQGERQRGTDRYRAVVLASGLNTASGPAAGDRPLLPWIESPHGPFGVACTLPWCSAIESGVIYMACDDQGYVGMVVLEDGRIDVAAALDHRPGEGGTIASRVAAILDRSGLPVPPLETLAGPEPPGSLLTTGPLRRSRLAGRGQVLAIGDAAGYVEPFTGEGMAWAVQSGIAAANRIAAEWDNLDGIGDRWDEELGALMRGRRNRCRRIAWAIHSPAMRAVAATALRRFPWLARPIVRSLERGT